MKQASVIIAAFALALLAVVFAKKPTRVKPMPPIGDPGITFAIKPGPVPIPFDTARVPIIVLPPRIGPTAVMYSGTAPTLDDAGTSCAAHVYKLAHDSLTVRWLAFGTRLDTGSVWLAPGDSFQFVTVAPDSVRVWAERGGLTGCDTTVTR